MPELSNDTLFTIHPDSTEAGVNNLYPETDLSTLDRIINPTHSYSTNAPVAVDEKVTPQHYHTWTEGITPLLRPATPGSDSGIVTLLVVTLIMLMINVRQYTTFIKSFGTNLFQVRRRRANVFDNNTTSEWRITTSSILTLCICEGIIAACMLYNKPGSSSPFALTSLFAAVAALYYLFQVIAYNTIGWTFTDPTGRRQWIKGFNASQSLLGLIMTIPAMTMLFAPTDGHNAFIAAIGLYLLARIIFIIKGFRIFYTNFSSVVYFILYLCALEIIPPYVIFKFATAYAAANL